MSFQPIVDQKQQIQSQALSSINLTLEGLPSKGRAYPDGAEVSYTPYTFGEIKKISQSNVSEREYLEFVVSGIKTNFDQLLITISDLMYIGLLRKISSLGKSKFSLKSNCVSCKKENSIDFTLANLDFDDLEVELPLIFDLERDSGQTYEFHFSPVTLGDFYHLIETDLSSDIIAVLASCCRNMDFQDSYDIFSSFTLAEAEYMNEVDKYLYHGVKPLPTTCAFCKKEFKINLEVGQTLVLPFRGDKEPPKGRIRFGIQARN